MSTSDGLEYRSSTARCTPGEMPGTNVIRSQESCSSGDVIGVDKAHAPRGWDVFTMNGTGSRFADRQAPKKKGPTPLFQVNAIDAQGVWTISPR